MVMAQQLQVEGGIQSEVVLLVVVPRRWLDLLNIYIFGVTILRGFYSFYTNQFGPFSNGIAETSVDSEVEFWFLVFFPW